MTKLRRQMIGSRHKFVPPELSESSSACDEETFRNCNPGYDPYFPFGMHATFVNIDTSIIVNDYHQDAEENDEPAHSNLTIKNASPDAENVSADSETNISASDFSNIEETVTVSSENIRPAVNLEYTGDELKSQDVKELENNETKLGNTNNSGSEDEDKSEDQHENTIITQSILKPDAKEFIPRLNEMFYGNMIPVFYPSPLVILPVQDNTPDSDPSQMPPQFLMPEYLVYHNNSAFIVANDLNGTRYLMEQCYPPFRENPDDQAVLEEATAEEPTVEEADESCHDTNDEININESTNKKEPEVTDVDMQTEVGMKKSEFLSKNIDKIKQNNMRNDSRKETTNRSPSLSMKVSKNTDSHLTEPPRFKPKISSPRYEKSNQTNTTSKRFYENKVFSPKRQPFVNHNKTASRNQNFRMNVKANSAQERTPHMKHLNNHIRENSFKIETMETEKKKTEETWISVNRKRKKNRQETNPDIPCSNYVHSNNSLVYNSVKEEEIQGIEDSVKREIKDNIENDLSISKKDINKFTNESNRNEGNSVENLEQNDEKDFVENNKICQIEHKLETDNVPKQEREEDATEKIELDINHNTKIDSEQKSDIDLQENSELKQEADKNIKQEPEDSLKEVNKEVDDVDPKNCLNSEAQNKYGVNLKRNCANEKERKTKKVKNNSMANKNEKKKDLNNTKKKGRSPIKVNNTEAVSATQKSSDNLKAKDPYDIFIDNNIGCVGDCRTNSEISQVFDRIITKNMCSNLKTKTKAENDSCFNDDTFQTFLESTISLGKNNKDRITYISNNIANPPLISNSMRKRNFIVNDIHKSFTEVSKHAIFKNGKELDLVNKEEEEATESKTATFAYPVTEAVKSWLENSCEDILNGDIVHNQELIQKELLELTKYHQQNKTSLIYKNHFQSNCDSILEQNLWFNRLWKSTYKHPEDASALKILKSGIDEGIMQDVNYLPYLQRGICCDIM